MVEARPVGIILTRAYDMYHHDCLGDYGRTQTRLKIPDAMSSVVLL